MTGEDQLTEQSGKPQDGDYDNWPYNYEEAETRLNLKEIRKQGRFFLNRALNIERVVAFVGVGASMAYGRVTWGELALVQIDSIDVFFKLHWNNLPPHLKELVEQLRSLRVKVVQNDPDTITLSMQIAEQIWIVCPIKLREELKEQFALESAPADMRRSEQIGSYYFRSVIKRQTVSELPHIISILSNKYPDKPSDKFDEYAAEAKKEISKNHSIPSLAGLFHSGSTDHKSTNNTVTKLLITSAFSISMMEKVQEALAELGRKNETIAVITRLIQPHLSTMVDDIVDYLKDKKAKSRRETLPPFRYFYLGLILDLLRLSKSDIEVAESFPNIIKTMADYLETQRKKTLDEFKGIRRRTIFTYFPHRSGRSIRRSTWPAVLSTLH